MKIDFHRLISKDYLFSIQPGQLHLTDKLILGMGIALVVVAIVSVLARMKAKAPFDKQLWRKLGSAFFTTGLLLLVWFGLRYELVRFFGSHFIAFAILLGWLIRMLWLARQYFKNRKGEVNQWEREQIKLKYLQAKR